MELRVLQYFLAVTREQSILKAAESLHLSQPTLSRQIRDMEEELGKQLFIRGSRSITLTEEGMILRKRAEEILELVRKAEDEVALVDEPVAGDVTVGAGETDGLRVLVRAARALREGYPRVHFHVVSGDKSSVIEQLDGGLIDFGAVFGDFDKSKYEYLSIPRTERFGVLLRRDDPLAEKAEISPQDLWNKPLIVSRQSRYDQAISEILDRDQAELNVVGSYNLLFNGSLMVEEGSATPSASTGSSTPPATASCASAPFPGRMKRPCLSSGKNIRSSPRRRNGFWKRCGKSGKEKPAAGNLLAAGFVHWK